MNKLLQGILEFRETDFLEYKELFNNLGKAQNPHTLFIGCADSRVVPNLITKTLPGELFVIRNIANIIPPYRVNNDEFLATTSAIEYAVEILEVENIVVCGHSNCGGISALFQPPEKLEKIPNVVNWLKLTGAVKDKSLQTGFDPAKREWFAEQLNVIEQLNHLLTYPFIKERVDKGEIKLYGWYYLIESGEVLNYNFSTGYFEVIRGNIY